MNILGLGLPELIVIALVLLLFFGKDRLPGLFRSIGQSVKELKDGLTESDTKQAEQPPVQSTSPTPTATPTNESIGPRDNTGTPDRS